MGKIMSHKPTCSMPRVLHISKVIENKIRYGARQISTLTNPETVTQYFCHDIVQLIAQHSSTEVIDDH